MKALRILIKGWTASFRFPGFISGYQPTLPVPPLSTVYGLISAAKGEFVGAEDVSIGYVFTNEGKAVDIEVIYELSPGLTAKSNVVKREFLLNPELYLYINDLSYETYFRRPHYPLLLGRSGDLVSVVAIEKVELKATENVKLGNTILPFWVEGSHGLVQALPTQFTDTIPRKAVGVKTYLMMNEFFTYKDKCPYDEEKDWGIWFHK